MDQSNEQELDAMSPVNGSNGAGEGSRLQSSISSVQAASAEEIAAAATSLLPRIKIEQSANSTPRTQTPMEEILPMLDGAGDTVSHAGSEAMGSTSLKEEEIEETMRAIAEAQNEHNVRERSNAATRNTARSDHALTPDPADLPSSNNKPTTKKRPGPKAADGETKRASSGPRKPPPKKRKVDVAGERKSGTPASRRLGRGSATPAASSSPQPGQRAAADLSDAASEDMGSDEEVYCICRRPDNHTWMIGCDGGCEDWFHGKCVKIDREDEDLIDKYICPVCEQKERGVTTWKPMCRREGCRKPARLKKGSESKYCADACGKMFMLAKLKAGTCQALPVQKSNKRQRPRGSSLAAVAVDDDETSSDPEHVDLDLGPLGGPIRAHEVRSLAFAANTADAFRRLGSPTVHTPPPASSTADEPHNNDGEAHTLTAAATSTTNELSYATAAETARLQEISRRKDILRARRMLLKDREKLVVMTKRRAVASAEQLKVKELCGFDSRLAWDDTEFQAWRESSDGQAALANDTLEERTISSTSSSLPAVPAVMNADTSEDPSAVPPAVDTLICSKKRCNRHKDWQKVMLQDVRFEEADVTDEMRRIDTEEKELRQEVARRAGVAGAVDVVKGIAVVDGEAMIKENEMLLDQIDGSTDMRRTHENSEGWVEILNSNNDDTEKDQNASQLIDKSNQDSVMSGVSEQEVTPSTLSIVLNTVATLVQ